VEVEGLQGVYPRVMENSNCIGCGICVDVCPKKDVLAIDVYPKDLVPVEERVLKVYIDT
jgi:ferredoxin